MNDIVQMNRDPTIRDGFVVISLFFNDPVLSTISICAAHLFVGTRDGICSYFRDGHGITKGFIITGMWWQWTAV